MASKYPIKVNNSGDATEILLHGPIGRSFWDDDGVSSKDFINELKAIPVGKKITIGINSQGGNIQDGLAIYNAIDARRADITARVDGYAVSIASVIPLAAGKVISPKSSIWMIHEPWSFTQGDAEDHRKSADMLDTHAEVLVAAYVKKTGKTDEQIRAAMKDETWLSGEEAQEWNLADEVTEKEPILNLDLSAAFAGERPKFKLNALGAVVAGAVVAGFKSIKGCKTFSYIISAHAGGANKQKQQDNTMKREEIIALLKTWGVNVADNATDEWIKAELAKGKPAAAIDGTVKDNARIEKLEAKYEAERKTRLKASLAALVTNEQLSEAQAVEWLPRVLADETILAQIQTWPQKPKAAEPVGIEASVSADASLADYVVGVRKCEEVTKSWQRGNAVTMEAIRNSACTKAGMIQTLKTKFAGRFGEVMNTNTIDTAFKRDVILQTMVEDFARRTLNLNLFSTVFYNVPLLGTNKVQVPFYDLDTSASQVFAAATGYNTIGDTALDNREITIGTGATDGGRWYQGLAFTSEEFARMPFLKIENLARLKADKLASDIIADILSVVTAANYGAAAVTKAAALFDSDDVADLVVAAKLWPDMGRGLVLDSVYHGALLKDPAFKGAHAAASDSAIKEGKLFPRVFGFDYAENPTMPGNGENLVGFIVFQSAILVAFAPVPPIQEVRNAGTTYQVAIDPKSGVALEYRTFGDNVLDRAVHLVESSFGWAKGNGNALKRITSA